MNPKHENRRSVITEHVLKRFKYDPLPQRSLHVTHFQPSDVSSLELEEMTEHVDLAYRVRLYGGKKLQLAIVRSEEAKNLLVRKLKELGRFIAIVVETGRETIDELARHVMGIFKSGLKFLQRSERRHRHVRRGRSTENYHCRQMAFR